MHIPAIDVSPLSFIGPGLASFPNDCWLIRRDVGVLTIDDLPDDDLLAIFDFYVVPYQDLNFL